jgi:VWFA-related protein
MQFLFFPHCAIRLINQAMKEHMINRAFHFLIVLLMVAPPVASSQRQQDEPVRLKTDLVSVASSVKDKQGRVIKSLKAEDFIVYEDGRQQQIAHFAATEEPFTLMLLLDISGSTRDEIALIKRAAKKFLEELRPDDRVGVIVFSREVEMIAELTDTRERVVAEIDRAATPQGNGEYQFNSKTGTSFYDALYLAIEESPLKQAEGRKAIICMSDGVDSTSLKLYRDIQTLAEKSEAALYFLQLNTEEATLAGLLKPRSDPGYLNFSESQVNRYYDEFDPDAPGRATPRHAISPLMRREMNVALYELARRQMKEMTERTGGRVYPVFTLMDLVGVYKQVADDLRSQYLIGYYPTNDKRDGRWRTIRVEVRAKDASVRARSGYRAN